MSVASFVLLGTYAVQRKESVVSWRTVMEVIFWARFPWLDDGLTSCFGEIWQKFCGFFSSGRSLAFFFLLVRQLDHRTGSAQTTL
jgi:hypothetical protein